MIQSIIKRNLKIYFRDKTAVFFSLLSVVIIILLFILFLAQLQVDTILESLNNSQKGKIPSLMHSWQMGGLKAILGNLNNNIENKIAYLVHTWTMGGLLSVTTLTSVLGGYGTMVNDKEKKIIMGFKSSPVKNSIYSLANVISSFLIGIIVSLIAFVIYFFCIYFTTGYLIDYAQIIKTILIIIISSFANSIICGCICSFLKTNNVFSSLSILIGTTIGFINGLYVPIGSLNNVIISIMNFFPTLHIATIFRKILTSNAINLVFENAPQDAMDNYILKYGVKLQFNGLDVNLLISVIYVFLFCFVSLLIMIHNVKKKKEEL